MVRHMASFSALRASGFRFQVLGAVRSLDGDEATGIAVVHEAILTPWIPAFAGMSGGRAWCPLRGPSTVGFVQIGRYA